MDFGLSEQERERQLWHRNETRVSGLIATCISAAVASTFIIALRILSRQLLHGRLRLNASDWLILVAWVLFVVIDVSWAVGTRYGIGRHAVVATDVHIIQILAVVLDAASFLTIALIKLSILLPYFAAFSKQRRRYCVWAVASLVVAWAMSGAVTTLFQCTSIEYVWRPDAQALCIDISRLNLILGIIDVVTDICILVLAAPPLRNMLSTKRNKWPVLVTLVVGSSACIITIVRLPYCIKTSTSDKTWDATPAIILGIVEIVVLMLAFSMPTYRPLYEQIFRKDLWGDDDDARGRDAKESIHMDFYSGDPQNDVNVTSPGTHTAPDHVGINVTNHIELVRHMNKCGNWVRVTDEDEEELCRSREHI